MFTKNELLGCLCCYDPRNPVYAELYDVRDDICEPGRDDCYCDNCFYGRDKIARYCLGLLETIEKGSQTK